MKFLLLQRGETCLHVATKYGQSETVSFLTSIHINLDLKDTQHGEAALHIAAAHGYTRILQVKKKDVLRTKNAVTNAYIN